MKQNKFDIDYFINNFENIPEDKIIEGLLYDGNGGHCAEGWSQVWGCSKDLDSLFKINFQVYPSVINNEKYKEYNQETPKKRILAALNYIKNKDNKLKIKNNIDIPKELLNIQESDKIDYKLEENLV